MNFLTTKRPGRHDLDARLRRHFFPPAERVELRGDTQTRFRLCHTALENMRSIFAALNSLVPETKPKEHSNTPEWVENFKMQFIHLDETERHVIKAKNYQNPPGLEACHINTALFYKQLVCD
jgi:hypothetical protein